MVEAQPLRRTIFSEIEDAVTGVDPRREDVLC